MDVTVNLFLICIYSAIIWNEINHKKFPQPVRRTKASSCFNIPKQPRTRVLHDLVGQQKNYVIIVAHQVTWRQLMGTKNLYPNLHPVPYFRIPSNVPYHPHRAPVCVPVFVPWSLPFVLRDLLWSLDIPLCLARLSSAIKVVRWQSGLISFSGFVLWH